MKNMEYYLGLDMGTSSVGWAVTDEQYNLIRAKGKDLWGIREFEEASTSVDRRSKRVSRRRHQRNQVRMGLIKSYFAEAIMKMDSNFFARLENSKYHLEDKDAKVRAKNVLFNDPDYKDADYFREYPTIFHLRKELIENSAPHDVRLVYLAIINMFKHRGHFLNAGLSADGDDRSVGELFRELADMLEEYVNIVIPTDIDYEQMEHILGSKSISRSEKAENISGLLSIAKSDKVQSAYIKLICGLKADVRQLFPDAVFDDDFKYSILFNDYSYDDKISEIIESIGEDNYQVIECAKALYDKGILAGIMKGYPYLSFARVESYNKHKDDLALLKKVMGSYDRIHGTKDYDLMFRSDTAGSYSAYVGSLNHNGKSRRSADGRKQEELYKTIKDLIRKYPEDENTIYISREIELGTFLPKQLSFENGVIPNQAHAKELKKIIKNAKSYLDFLNDKDESGLTVAERIIRLFSFQIPYYIGPISENSEKNGGNGWVVRKEEGPVLPWNFEQKIDVSATSVRFIERLVRDCTYINGEKVLPKASLMYERYAVLNEINNIKINGEKIPVELKQDIYTDLFKKGRKVTRKQLERYLINRGVLKDAAELSGIDITINNSLSSYGKFLPIFGEDLERDNIRNAVEDIIALSTIYGDSKKLLKEQLEAKYSDILKPNDIKRILGLKFKDWGRLSREFIQLSGCDKSSGEIVPLIRMMWETNNNMMELIHSNEYTYDDVLAQKSRVALASLFEVKYEDIEDMYFSAPVRRMIWQTILIIKELSGFLGSEPKRLFVEMTRAEDDKKQRTKSRKQMFLDLYKNVKDEGRNWKGIIENADSTGALKSKKMYLYLTQMGKCMYTGEPIDLDDLFNDNEYDIDHIYPRHFVKDDNIANNLVLVKKKYNANKSDVYPLDDDIVRKQRQFWKILCEKNLITKEKYTRLTGRNPFSDEQKADFIARQLVETGQGTKGVTEVLKAILQNTEIVYSKARNVSDFRHDFNFPKSRLVNDNHHANDAYLNIVVGNVYYTKFTQNPINFIKKECARDGQKYNLDKMFAWKVERNGYVAWMPDDSGTISTVRRVMAKNTPLLTRKSFEKHGAIAKETLHSARKATQDAYIPLKTSDPKMQDVTKYGGFSDVAGAYFFLAEHEVKGKRVRTIETLPIYLKDKLEKDENELITYCVNMLGLKEPSIRLKKISYQALMKKDGYYMNLSGKTNKQLVMRNAVALCLNGEWVKYVGKLEKAISDNYFSDAIISREKNAELYDILKEKHINGIFAKRPNPMGKKLKEGRERFIDLDVAVQCETLIQIINLTGIGPVSADLVSIGGSKKSGVMLISKNISNSSECKIITQSITGVYEKEIDMLTI